MLRYLLYYQLKRTGRYFASRRLAKWLTLASFAIIFTGLAVGLYYFFVEGFSYIGSYPFFARALTLYSYEIYLLLITLLIVVSAFITASLTMFHQKDTEWMVATPSYKQLLHLTFFKTLTASLWPLLIIALPGLLAIHTVFGLTWAGLIVSIFSIVALTFAAVSGVYLLLLMVGKMLHVFSVRSARNFLTFKNLVSSIVGLFVIVSGMIWYSQFSLDLISLFKAQDLSKETAGVEAISNNFIFSPAHPVAKMIFHFQTGQPLEAFSLFLLLIGLTAAAAGAIWILSPWYLPIWQRLQEGSFTAHTNKKKKRTKKEHRAPKYLMSSPLAALFKKEILVSTRNMKNMMWFTFLLLIWLMQTGVNLILSKSLTQYEINIEMFPVIAHILQFLTGIFFISAFVLRFVFPSFSMEKNTAWILVSSPLQKHRVFWSKLLFYLPLFLLLGVIIGYSNLLILDISLSYILPTLSLFFTAVLFVVTLGLTLGAIFPSFETDDPSALSTSIPGIGFILGSLAYGGISALLLFRVLQREGYIWFSVLILFTFLLILGLIFTAVSSLKKKEFVKKKIS